MATDNSFKTYNLTPPEQITAQQLSTLNVRFIQNQRAAIAEEKLHLPFTPNDPLSYAQQEAYLRGQLDMLAYLLACHDESTPQYNQIVSQSN